jgi:hypothetical protein
MTCNRPTNLLQKIVCHRSGDSIFGVFHFRASWTCDIKGDPGQEPRVISIRNMFKYGLECWNAELGRQCNLTDMADFIIVQGAIVKFSVAIRTIIAEMLRKGSGNFLLEMS